MHTALRKISEGVHVSQRNLVFVLLLLVSGLGVLSLEKITFGLSTKSPNEFFAGVFIMMPTALVFIFLARERSGLSQELELERDRLSDALHKLSLEEETKNEFLSILAHELRNPLATILSTVELIGAQGADAHETPVLLGVVEERVRAMALLLDEFLDVSRLSKKTFVLNKKVFSLVPILKKCGVSIQTYLGPRGHTLDVIVLDEDITLEADPQRLEQIIVTLLNASLKYCSSPCKLTLSAERDRDMVRIRLIDGSGGIPNDILAAIFEPFLKTRQEGSEKETLVVGLAITQQLVELHGGTLVAHRMEGCGSEFVITLPSLNLSVAVAPVAELLSKAVAVASSSLRILVVDDNDVAADSLGQLLTLRGYTVEVAHSGVQAFEKAVTFFPNVAILDIGMPGLDGYEVAGLLRAEHFSCTYIALTGYGQIHDKKRALHAGFDYHLTKPAGLKEIEVILRKVASTLKKTEQLSDQSTLAFSA